MKPLLLLPLLALALPAACGRRPEPHRRAVPHDGLNFSGAEELLIKEFRLTGIGLDMTEADVAAQTRPGGGELLLEQALRLALAGFLEDRRDPAGPLADKLRRLGLPAAPSGPGLEQARAALLAEMNSGSASLSLLKPGELAPRGESTEENWIFRLDLDGRRYWSVVPRRGADPYNYGSGPPHR